MRICFSLADDRHELQSELTDVELMLLGSINVSWAYLEHQLFAVSSALANDLDPGADIQINIRNVNLMRRLEAFKTLIDHVADADTKKYLTSLRLKMSGLKRSRERITHGLWDWEPRFPAKMIASSFRPRHEFTEPFDSEKLQKLARAIAHLNFLFAFPGGKKQAQEEMFQAMEKKALI